MAAKKKVWVRHRNLNGDELVLQRKVLSVWAIVTVIPALLGFGWRWKDWKLLNAELYQKEEQISNSLDNVSKLLNECFEIEQYLKSEKKDVNESTRETRGYSAPFQIDVNPKELPFKKQKWMHRPDGKWRGLLNPKAFKNLNSTSKPSTREKVGATEEARAIRTAYTLEDFKGFKYQLEDANPDFDGVVAYKEPQKKGNNNNNNNNGNNRKKGNRQQRYNMNDEEDDDDD